MDALESPLEALAFNYLAYGFLTAVNNIWAWVAVITAAVSFWRIKASSSAAVLSCQSQDATPSSTEPPQLRLAQPEDDAAVVSAPIKKSLEREGSTKMKFSLVYREEEVAGGGGGGGEREDSGDGAAAGVSEEKWWCDDWERMMVMRMGNMGWYRWQDTTALDGSVVRLWEGRRKLREAAVLVDGGVVWCGNR